MILAEIMGWTLLVIVAYLLLTNGSSTIGIANSTTGGGIGIIKALQGR